MRRNFNDADIYKKFRIFLTRHEIGRLLRLQGAWKDSNRQWLLNHDRQEVTCIVVHNRAVGYIANMQSCDGQIGTVFARDVEPIDE